VGTRNPRRSRVFFEKIIMLYICHRANIDKKDINTENRPQKINYCIGLGYDVEIDVRYINSEWWLGHDVPQYKVSFGWINKLSRKLWIHCKNYQCLFKCDKNWNYFWHDQDDYTITSNGFIWSYPGSELNHRCIAVMPENVYYSINNLSVAHGICSDNIEYYQNLLKEKL